MSRAGAKTMDKEPLFLCSYPKSGRTWLRFLLATYLNDVYSLGVDVDLRSMFTILPNHRIDTTHPKRGPRAYRFGDDPRVPLILSCHHAYCEAFARGRVLFMLRSPFDVLVSSFFHDSRQVHSFSGSITEYLRDPSFGVDRLIGYLNSWAGVVERRRSLVVTYEQMHRDTLAVLSRAVEFFGLPADEHAMHAAVRSSTFEHMLAKELREGIPGFAYDPSDIHARRVRSGRIGGYIDHLDTSDKEYIRRRCADALTTAAQRLLSRFDLMPLEAPGTTARLA